MAIFYTDEQKELIALVRDVAQNEILPHVAAADEARGPKVFLRTAFGSTRILDMLVGEQLPRIC